ncbi:MAG TPA: helix-turn-helix domain-containing protein [Planctomycetaceae bacterium]|jgi:plasmid maintenance system antidote protein VapI|nr:helix-turn-helix domain-containing protein [Planctomycetaceae bacterium]
MKATKSERPIVRALRKAIKDDPRTINALAVDAGVPVPTLSRFVQGERSMTLDSAAALAEALGLELRSKE